MKKSLLFLLGLSAAAAHAQSQVSIYGVVDAGIVAERGGQNAPGAKVSSGAASASRIGFRGTEHLGNGWSAFFTLETGARIDSGVLDAGNTIFNRQAFVGLQGDFGAVALGRQYTPMHILLVAFDPFKTGYAGTVKNLFPDIGTNIRTSNTITWKSPSVHGVDGMLAYSAGEQSDASAGRQFGGAVGYAQGPIAVRLAYNHKNSDVAATDSTPFVSHGSGRNTVLGASYQFPKVKLHFIYGIDKGYGSTPLWNTGNPYGGVKPIASTDGRDLLLGLSGHVGPGTLMFSTMRKDDRTTFDQDASSWGVGYNYPLSKRTSLYAAYAHIDNKNGAGYTVNNNAEAGSGNTGTNIGLLHTF